MKLDSIEKDKNVKDVTQSIVEEKRRKHHCVLHVDKALRELDEAIRFKFDPHRFLCVHVK